MALPLRPQRGGYLRPFGAAIFIRDFLAGEGPKYGAARIDSAQGAPQADIHSSYKLALHMAMAEDSAAWDAEAAIKAGRPMTPQWRGVLQGIISTLEELGYRVGVVEHRRTSGGLGSAVRELREIIGGYGSKAAPLSFKVDFLTRTNPDTKIIVTGMSSGAAYSNAVLTKLEGNPSVYSIQAGRPFWYRGGAPEEP